MELERRMEGGGVGRGRADHSGELRRGRRECFSEQVIDISGVRGGRWKWAGVVDNYGGDDSGDGS